MKNILKYAAAAVFMIVTLYSCDSRQEFIKYPTKLNFTVTERGVANVKITITPDEDRVYFYATVISKDSLDALKITDAEYLDQCISIARDTYEYVDSVAWQGKKYKCSFYDYAMGYATVSRTFTGLEMGTKYVVLARCYNPDINQCMGYVQTFEFSTLDISEVKESDMKFDFMVVTKGEDEVRLYVKPQYENKTGISKDIYLTPEIMPKAVVDTVFGGDVLNVIDYLLEKAPELDYYLHRDISELYYETDYYYYEFNLGEEYVAIACPYSLDYADHIYTLTFVYDRDLKIDYSHDKK